MKKVLNGIGIFFSIITTIVLSAFIISYVVTMNFKKLANEGTLTKTLENVDLVSVFKEADNGKMWNNIVDFGNNVSLTEMQLIEIVNSETIKKDIASYISRILQSIDSDEDIKITSEELQNTMSLAIDEYNKVGEVKISPEDKTKIINSINLDRVASLNEDIGFLDIRNHLFSDDGEIELSVVKVAFEYFSLFMIISMIIMVLIIALFRLSYYKWMGYTGVGSLSAAGLLLGVNILLSIARVKNTGADTLINELRNTTINNFYKSIIILLIVSIVLLILNKVFKTLNRKSRLKETQKNNTMAEESVKEVCETKNESKVEEIKTEEPKEIEQPKTEEPKQVEQTVESEIKEDTVIAKPVVAPKPKSTTSKTKKSTPKTSSNKNGTNKSKNTSSKTKKGTTTKTSSRNTKTKKVD